MDNVLFSVVIPTYNTCEYIEQCVESFEKQNFNGFEIVICDDGSTDGTIELLNDLKNKYKNVRVEFNKHIGAGSARNKGIELANGEYIFFCDSDDYVSDNFFDVLCNEIEVSKPDILFFNYNEIIDGKINSTVIKKETKEKYDFFYRNSCIWSSIYKKTLLVNNGIKFPSSIYHQDDAIYFRLIEKANIIKSVDNVLYNYRKFRPGSSMNTKSEKYYNDILVVAEMNLDFFSSQPDKKGYDCIVDVYVGKLFDYILFNLAHSTILVTQKYYEKTIYLLDKCSKNWRKNIYFYDNQVSIVTRFIRNTLKNKLIFNCYNTKIIKNALKRKMRNYQ